MKVVASTEKYTRCTVDGACLAKHDEKLDSLIVFFTVQTLKSIRTRYTSYSPTNIIITVLSVSFHIM